MSSSGATQRPMSKLKRRIQAGVATAPLECSSSHQSMAATIGSTPMEIEEPNRDEIGSSLVKNFLFSINTSELNVTPSKFAEALPTPTTGPNYDQLFSLPPDVFLQPCKPNTFQGPSPDDEIIIARRGTSLGSSLHKT